MVADPPGGAGARRRPDHSRDAGGDADLLTAKRALRDRVWSSLSEAGVVRFPGARGRIPNFRGAEDAAARLLEAWPRAELIKANPDSPQWPVRSAALARGTRVLMAVPRLAGPQPFLLLDPERLSVRARTASSIKGSSSYGTPVGADDVGPVDLVVVGCVAVDHRGRRLGKGGGFADLEYAIGRAAGLIPPDTPVVTTVHPLQIVDDGDIPEADHDVRLDAIVTPDQVIRCTDAERGRHGGIVWDELTPGKIAAIPVLSALAREEGRASS